MWSKEKLYFDADEYFDSLAHAIRTAEQEVLFESYIFDQDQLGDKMVDALKSAADRGLVVKVLVDGIGSTSMRSSYGAALEASGVQVRTFHPVGFRYGFRWIALLNRRNHRKACLIDQKRLFLGSMNVTSKHCKSAFGALAWRDTSVELEPDNASRLDLAMYSESFNRAWNGRWSLASFATESLLLNVTLLLRMVTARKITGLIKTAQKRIWITNAYFVPTKKILKTISQAAQAGIDVRMIVPAYSDVPPVQLASTAFYQSLIRAGVHIFEYQPSMLHAKTMLIDQVGIVGSSNLNHRSLLHDLEMDAIVTHPDSIRAMALRFEQDCTQSERITLQTVRSRPVYKRLLARILLLLRYWM